MRLVVLVLVAALAVGAYVLWPRDSAPRADACGPIEAQPRESGLAAASEATICLLNRQRAQHGLPGLQENALLNAASLEHSRDMVARGYFDHTAADGRTVSDRLRAVGYARGVSASAGENIAYGVGRESTPAAIVRQWMRSPPHRADILRPAFTEIGIGIALGAPQVSASKQGASATYTTDFGGRFDPSLPSR